MMVRILFQDAQSILMPLIGYHGDLNETYPVGEVDEDSKRLMRAARHSLDEAIKICKPGALIRDIGKVMSVGLFLLYCHRRD